MIAVVGYCVPQFVGTFGDVCVPRVFIQPGPVTTRGGEPIWERGDRRPVWSRLAMGAPEPFSGSTSVRYLSTSEKVKFADVPNGVQALFKIPTLGLLQILLFIGASLQSLFVGAPDLHAFELGILETQFPNQRGDYGTGYFGQFLEEPVKSKKLSVEISNGRLAMLAIMGLFFQDVVSKGHPFDGPQFELGTFTSL